MIESFTLKSRNKDMVCLIDYKDESSKGNKVILFKHGFLGNKISSHRKIVNLSHILVEMGITVVRFDCIGAGDSEGDFHYTTIEGELEDTFVVINHIKNCFDMKKFIILGYSMGGCVAALAAQKVNPDGLILWSPVSNPFFNFCDLLGKDLFLKGISGEDVDFMGDMIGKEFFKGLNNPQINPLSAIKEYKKPVRIIHGDADDEVSNINTLAYAEAATNIKYHIVKGASHSYDSYESQSELFENTIKYINEIFGSRF